MYASYCDYDRLSSERRECPYKKIVVEKGGELASQQLVRRLVERESLLATK